MKKLLSILSILAVIFLGSISLSYADVACSTTSGACAGPFVTATPAPTSTPQPTATVAPTVTPQPTATPQSTATPAPTFPSTGSFGTVVPYFTYTDTGNSGTSKTINWSTGGEKQKITTTGSCTVTFTAPAGPSVVTLVIVHEASATAYTYTWPVTVKWPSGSAIATTNTSGAVDIISCYYDSTNYYCVPSTNFS